MALRVSSSAPTTYISQLQSSSSSSSSSVVVSFSFKSHPLLLSPCSFASSSFSLSPIRRLRSPRSRVVRAEAAVGSGNGAVLTADKPDSNTPTPSGRLYFPLAAVVGQVLAFFFSLCVCAFWEWCFGFVNFVFVNELVNGFFFFFVGKGSIFWSVVVEL